MNQNDTHSPKFCGIRNLTLIQTQYLGSSPLHHNISTTTLNLYESLGAFGCLWVCCAAVQVCFQHPKVGGGARCAEASDANAFDAFEAKPWG